MTNFRNHLYFLLLGAIALIILPYFISSRFYIDVLTLIFFTAYLGQSWNILGGYAGQFSFGGVMFFGTGAYVSSILLTTFGFPPIFGNFLAIMGGALLGLVLKALTLR